MEKKTGKAFEELFLQLMVIAPNDGWHFQAIVHENNEKVSFTLRNKNNTTNEVIEFSGNLFARNQKLCNIENMYCEYKHYEDRDMVMMII